MYNLNCYKEINKDGRLNDEENAFINIPEKIKKTIYQS